MVGRRDADVESAAVDDTVCRTYELVIVDFRPSDVGLYTCCEHGDNVDHPLRTAWLTITGNLGPDLRNILRQSYD